MQLSERYTFEAEMQDGSVITKGGDLAGAVRVSLIPAPGAGLPRHDLVGVKFVRRFMRVFQRSRIGGFDAAAYWAEVEARQGGARKLARAARNQRIVDGTLALKPVEPMPPPKPQKPDECLQVVCCEAFWYYVRHSDGTALITPPDCEVYL